MASSASLTTTHLPRIRSQLEEWRNSHPSHKGFTTSLSDISTRVTTSEVKEGKDIVVAFRTRPPLKDEAETKFVALATSEPDENPEVTDSTNQHRDGSQPVSAFCPGITVASAEPGEFVAHVPGFKWSGPTLTHKTFTADLAFGPEADNEEVYQRTIVANELLTLALSGGISCILAYGQTGSGKTYTMEALEHRVARDLFTVAKLIGRRLREAEGSQFSDPDSDGDEIFEFSATFLELLGKRAVDLLEPADGLALDAQGNAVRKEVVIQENKAGEVRPQLISTAFHSSDELENLITSALAHRRTSATLRNATSSRSHAVLTIRVKNKLLPYADEGQLILVDLAGSERYDDSKAHDKQRMDESRENNKSLMVLKDCVRAKAKMANEDGFVHIPWRMNKLTMLLKPIFDPESRQTSKTVIIAHVSPHIQDSTHSVNTLSYASPFMTSPPKPRGPAPYNPADPRTWNTQQTRQWLTAEFAKREKIRMQAAHQVKEKEAASRKKKLRPLDPDAPVQIAVDVEKLCPDGMTAVHFERMYTTQFVMRCLEVANIGGENTTEVVKKASAEVMGVLTYLTLSAKTKSRKRLEVESTYGGIPMQTILSSDPTIPFIQVPPLRELRQFQDDELCRAAYELGSQWTETLKAASTKAVETGDVEEDAIGYAIIKMVNAWKAQKTQGKQADDETK